MNLKDLVGRPQLKKITITAADIVNKYGDELEFYIYDRQPLDQFIKMATASQGDQVALFKMVNELVLDETGAPVVVEGQALPNDVTLAVIAAVIEQLGK
ncbi:hypothetical protein UFOVP700_24 [uncultured Caudovirales phage]|uniref:Uncharacterized protein n=1 Tax=uncultured Caudovirales phage TaxID=2100421 RepID=A0A6J5NNC6_9CAUD|nr:hypothetical protein UFOVP700_24 [uncultured Caudovirales phage]